MPENSVTILLLKLNWLCAKKKKKTKWRDTPYGPTAYSCFTPPLGEISSQSRGAPRLIYCHILWFLSFFLSGQNQSHYFFIETIVFKFSTFKFRKKKKEIILFFAFKDCSTPIGWPFQLFTQKDFSLFQLRGKSIVYIYHPLLRPSLMEPF